MAVQQISEADFAEKALKADKPVVVEFFKYKEGGRDNASKRMSKVVDDWASAEDRAIFLRIPLAESTNIAQKYDVQSAPTLLYFVGGEKKEELVGYYTEDRPKALLARLL